MAINRVLNPVAAGTPPTITTGYEYQNNVLEVLAENAGDPNRVDGSNIVKGATFYIQGVWYRADSTTAITGTASNYVKITPSGATASASFVTSGTFTGNRVWDEDYNGWYDGSGNLYVFDEGLAEIDGDIAASKTPNGTVRGLVVQDAIDCNISLSKTVTTRIGLSKTTITDQDFTVNYPCFVLLQGTQVVGHVGNYYTTALKAYKNNVDIAPMVDIGGATLDMDSFSNTSRAAFLMPGTYLLTTTTTGSPSPTSINIKLDIRGVFGTTEYERVIS